MMENFPDFMDLYGVYWSTSRKTGFDMFILNFLKLHMYVVHKLMDGM